MTQRQLANVKTASLQTEFLFCIHIHGSLPMLSKTKMRIDLFFLLEIQHCAIRYNQVTFKYPVIDVELKDCRKDIPGVKKDLFILPFKRLTQ